MFDKKFLPFVLLISGAINVLLIKWSDRQYSKGRDDKLRLFEHPFIQTIILFYGEFLCFILYKILFLYLSRKRDGSEDTNFLTAGEREFSPLIFILPAICDIIATYLSFMGLCLTYASSYQMLKGISIIFIGIFSVSYLDYTLKKYHWFGMFIIILSSILICISDVYNSKLNINSIITGNLLIIISCIFRSYQYAYEEKYLKILNLPILQVIGWEGIYGLFITLILLIPFNFIKSTIPFVNNPNNLIEDIYDFLIQLLNNNNLIISHLLFIFIIIIELYSNKMIIKDSSCTGVILIYCINTILIWLSVLIFEWEYFNYIKLISLFILFFGICIYKNVLFGQIFRRFLITIFNRRQYNNDDNEEVINQPADAVII